MLQQENIDWFSDQQSGVHFQQFRDRPIAYFCAEYALSQKIPTYSGGLGILAGDVVREAADQKLPLVAIGLYYHQGYVCSPDVSAKSCVRINPSEVDLSLVLDDQKLPLKISVPIQDHEVFAQIWEFKQGDNSVYLLDTDIEDNNENDRRITDRLYVGDKETRFKQEIVLGIGGMRLIEALGIHPSIYHSNEGHSALLIFELIQHQMKERKLAFDEAKQFAKRRLVFTNHTLVAAGNEIYSSDLVSLMLSKYAQQINVPIAELLKIGLVQQSSQFSMTVLMLRSAGVINAVSKLHALKAKEVWTDHPMVAVTNGVHVGTWDQIKKEVSEEGSFWKIHQEKKEALIQNLNERFQLNWSKDDLLIGWARRFVSYKRPLAILDDIERYKLMANAVDRPLRLIIGGIPHPNDQEGNELLKKLKSLIENSLSGVAIYLPNYNMDQAKPLLSGCDIWLNTPIVGFEACGTSGMKAAMNGALPFSTKDGWIDEVDLKEAGWLIDSDNVTDSILTILEKKIIPLYYERNNSGVPIKWEAYMKKARALAIDQFCTTRMLRQYVQLLYL